MTDVGVYRRYDVYVDVESGLYKFVFPSLRIVIDLGPTSSMDTLMMYNDFTLYRVPEQEFTLVSSDMLEPVHFERVALLFDRVSDEVLAARPEREVSTH